MKLGNVDEVNATYAANVTKTANTDFDLDAADVNATHAANDATIADANRDTIADNIWGTVKNWYDLPNTDIHITYSSRAQAQWEHTWKVKHIIHTYKI